VVKAPSLNVSRLQQLACVVRCASFSEAAAALGISQPALSRSVRSLERQLGVKLLDRGRFGATPTEFGLALARHADAVDAELLAARGEIDALKSARSGQVCIGCGPSEATRLLPQALELLRQRAPQLHVTVLYGLNEDLLPMVKHGQVSFALSSIPKGVIDPDLKRIVLHEDRAAVVARATHPLAEHDSVQPQQLLNYSWVLARQRELERHALDEVFLGADLQPPTAAIETTSAVLMKSVIMQTDYLTFLPRELVYWEERAGLVRALKLSAPSWRRIVGITMRSRGALSPAAESLIEALQTTAQKLADVAPRAHSKGDTAHRRAAADE
jgi:DNA-binding transcriptional LysR family regulator